MARQRENPTSVFERALSVCVKTVAEKPDLVVTFGAERPSASEARVRLPQLSRRLPSGEVAVTRGLADRFALRLAYHDDAIHAAHLPKGAKGREVYDAVEEARIEAIGSRAMPGMAANMHAIW